MKKLSEYEGDEAIDVIVDVMDAIVPFLKDKEVMSAWRDKNVIAGFKASRKKYPAEFKEFLSAYSRIPVDEMQQLTSVKVLDLYASIMSDPIMMSFFASQSRKKDKGSFGSATESSEVMA